MFNGKFLIGCFFIIHSMFSFAVVSDPRFVHEVPCVPDYDFVSLETVLQKYGNEIRYQEFMPEQEVCFKPLPFAAQELSSYQPHHVTFDKTWVLTIPHGRVCSHAGLVVIDEKYLLRGLLCHCGWFAHQLNLFNWEKQMFHNPRKVSGRVAVITRRGAESYTHFIADVLGRLAILEIMGIDYDWLYVPYDKPHIKQILTAWGIDPLKIIEPAGDFNYIEADELIVPSLCANLKPTKRVTYNHLIDICAHYYPKWLTDYYRERFLPLVNKTPANSDRFSKRIFISRKDSIWRPMHNEDEVFALFEVHGFKKYLLSQLTFLEQIELFSGAEIVVGAHGAGFANELFCSPGTKIVEIFQERADTSFAFLAQSLGLDYIPVKTVEFPIHDRGGGGATITPLYIIEDVIKSLNL